MNAVSNLHNSAKEYFWELPEPVRTRVSVITVSAITSAIVAVAAKIFPILALSTAACIGMSTLTFAGAEISTEILYKLNLINLETQGLRTLAALVLFIPTALKIANFASSWWTVPTLFLASFAGCAVTEEILTA